MNEGTKVISKGEREKRAFLLLVADNARERAEFNATFNQFIGSA